MKRQRMEELVLLEQSGELNFIQRWRLERSLAREPGLVRFRDDLRRLTTVSRSAAPADELNPAVLGEIRKAAAEHPPHAPSWLAESASWLRPAIALAACAVVIFGIGLINQYRPPAGAPPVARMTGPAESRWNDGIDRELAGVSSLLAANFDVTSDVVPADVNDIARELLYLEGMGQ